MNILCIFTISIIYLNFIYSFIKVNPKTHVLEDESKREMLFNGMNVVYKIPPFIPVTSTYDPELSFSVKDADNLVEWGWNIVRLGMMWPGLNPSINLYNETYLEEMDYIINLLSERNIYILLDMHQDLLARRWCGEGVPPYIADLMEDSFDETMLPFPQPWFNTTYELNEDGLPDINDCLSEDSSGYYGSDAVSAAFQALYDNYKGIQDYYVEFWTFVANHYKDNKMIIGYELINEPFPGNIYDDPKSLLLPGYTERRYLQPLYNKLAKGIRSVDENHIIFYEGVVYDFLWEDGFTEVPGGDEYQDRSVLSYHVYCRGLPEVQCKIVDDKFIQERQNTIDRIGGGWMLTEFGSIPVNYTEMSIVNDQLNTIDSLYQSWIFWEYKYYKDPTSKYDQQSNLFLTNGLINKPKLKMIIRTHPVAVSGKNSTFSFDHKTNDFTLQFIPTEVYDNTSTDNKGITEINVNYKYRYTNGININIEPGDALALDEETCDQARNILKFYTNYIPNQKVKIKITQCNNNENCMCKD